MSLLRVAAVLAVAGLCRCAPQAEDGTLVGKRDQCNADNLLRLMRGTQHLADSQAFCTSYICRQAPTTTTTVYYWSTNAWETVSVTDAAHPMYLYNLHSQTTTTPPITYGSPPTPVPVGGNGNPSKKKLKRAPDSPAMVKERAFQAAAEANARAAELDAVLARLERKDNEDSPAAHVLDRRATTPCPSQAQPTWIPATYPPSRISSACSCVLSSTTATVVSYAIATTATYTATCTSYTSTAAQTTVAAFCDPSLYTNAVASPTAPSGAPPAAEATSTVPNRLACCQACALTLNCVYWKYLPDRTFPADAAHFIGGFDPWDSGKCVVGYNTALPTAAVSSETPFICPNGAGKEYLDLRQGVNATPGQYSSLYVNGWNKGACGNAPNLYQSNWECGCQGGCY